MSRNQTHDRPQKPRHDAERDAAQPIAGQPRDDDDDELQQPENVPSFLSAREFQVRGAAKAAPASDGAVAPDDEDDEAEDAPKRSPAKKR